MWRRRRTPRLSVVVPVYRVEAWLPACLDSLLGADLRDLEVVVVDDGSPDASGEIAEAYAARDRRVRVVHTANQGLGAARNEGLRHTEGAFVGFADSDDVVPTTAYGALVGSLETSGADFVTGSIVRWENGRLIEPRWMKRMHEERRQAVTAAEHPEILGDVFAWNKVFRREFWDGTGLAWPEGVRYEDQPTTTRAYLTGRFDVIPDVVYHWRIRDDGSSITQQRASLQDLEDRILTKRWALDSVHELGSPEVQDVFVHRVLAGDLWRYLKEIPGCPDAWWQRLHAMVAEFWDGPALLETGLPPVHRLTAWLVQQDRRDDATRLMEYVAARTSPPPRLVDGDDRLLDLPLEVLDPATVPREVLLLRPTET
jgi:CDP-glycerol glycerophosphotransferase